MEGDERDIKKEREKKHRERLRNTEMRERE